MELVCCERITENRAIVDPVLLNQEVLKNLLQVEDKSVVSRCDVQDEITSEMRKIVIIWMKEVIIISRIFHICIYSYIP